MSRPCQYMVFFTIASLAFFTLLLNSISVPHKYTWRSHKNALHKHPDFERYTHVRVLSPDEFPIDDPHRRVIIVGDIHGMKKPFERLLETIAYNHDNDVLVHTGDVLSKGHHSLGVIDYLTTHNITGVRGNHDQKIIEWKGWLDWFATLPGGNDWLSGLQSDWKADHAKGYKLKAWVKERRKSSRGRDAKWWNRIPHGWVPFGDHFRIAQGLTEEQYSYLISLPLKLHIPSAHAFIIHAGLLPYDVRYQYDDHKRQPLARIPHIRTNPSHFNQETTETLRKLQELSILRRVPQNTDPWVNLNIRSVVKNKKISRASSKGTPWSNYWNDQMSMCSGFNQKHGVQIQSSQRLLPDDSSKAKALPCFPASVIYGHAAARGLDIGQWTFGLDTGCVYGRKLSAMILGPNPLPNQAEWEEDEDEENDGGYDEDEDEDEGEDEDENSDRFGSDSESFDEGLRSEQVESKKVKTISFGEHARAKIVRVSCQR